MIDHRPCRTPKCSHEAVAFALYCSDCLWILWKTGHRPDELPEQARRAAERLEAVAP